MVKIRDAVGIKLNSTVVLTAICLLLKSVSSNVCTTPACRKASSDVLSFIDPSVDLCQDFYKFTCGGIFKKTYEEKPASLEEMAKKEVDDQTSLMLIKPIDPSEPKAIQALKKFFRSCIDEAAIEKYGYTSIERVLGLLGGWPVVEGPNWNEDSFSLDELLVKLRKMGYNFLQLLYIRTTLDKEGPSFMIDQPIVEVVEERIKENYHDYMVNIAMLLGADKKTASLELQETLLFKMKLLRILDEDYNFNKTPIQSVQEKYPFVHWVHLFENIINPEKTVFEQEEIYVPSNDYLENLSNLLEETSNRTLVNYLIWEAIEPVVPYLPKEFTDFRWQYIDSDNIRTEEKPKSRMAFCKKETSRVLRPTFEALFVKEYFPLQKKEAVQETASAVIEEFTNLLNSTDLYDDDTKNKMLEMANAISYTFGAPEEVFDEQMLSELVDAEENINTNDLLTIASILNRQSANHAVKLGTRYDIYESSYDQTVLPVAHYNTVLNYMVLPAGILQGLYFDDKRPQYLNFGSIGTTLAYNMIHGFTYKGSHGEGSLYNGESWTNTTTANFNKRTQCLIRQASNFEIDNSKLQMDGNVVLNENICDLTAVEVAYRAYENWIEAHGEEKQLPGLTYTSKQLFWISTASTYCQTVSLDELRDFIKNSQIPHPAFRTFNSLSNSVHFGKDFNCPSGSKMNPTNKCHIF